MFLLFLLGFVIIELLVYDCYVLESLEIWCLLLGNFVYINGYYLLLNGVGLFFLWVLYGEYYRFMLFIKLFLWCGLGISLGIYYLLLLLIWYVGLLGVLYGLFVWGVCMDICNKIYLGVLFLLGIVVKVGWE